MTKPENHKPEAIALYADCKQMGRRGFQCRFVTLRRVVGQRCAVCQAIIGETK